MSATHAGAATDFPPASADASASIGGGAGGTQARPAQPLLLNTQYVRDLVFRVPGAPGIYAVPQLRPHITVHIDVQVKPAQEGQPVFEVALLIQCTGAMQAPVEGQPAPPTAFTVELAYCGIFTLQGIAPEMVEPILLAECPRLLFPFARNVLADVTREAGFPPVLLQPIDFVVLWQNRRAARTQSAAQGQTTPQTTPQTIPQTIPQGTPQGAPHTGLQGTPPGVATTAG